MSAPPVVACYRGPDSADTVQLAALLARALGAPLVVATAYRYEPVSIGARPEPDPDNERRALAAGRALHRARAFAGADVELRERIVPATRIADALIELAAEEDACLIVVGRDTEGHVTRSLVPRAPCPVVVSPLSVPVGPTESLRRIGVAYDGSPMAQLALDAARQLALATGATLVLLAVGTTTDRANTWLHIARISIGRRLAVESRALTGDPAVELARAGADLDLLVCGSRGRRRALSAVLGSVSEHLAGHAQSPLLVVPPAVGRSPGSPWA